MDMDYSQQEHVVLENVPLLWSAHSLGVRLWDQRMGSLHFLCLRQRSCLSTMGTDSSLGHCRARFLPSIHLSRCARAPNSSRPGPDPAAGLIPRPARKLKKKKKNKKTCTLLADLMLWAHPRDAWRASFTRHIKACHVVAFHFCLKHALGCDNFTDGRKERKIYPY